MQQLDSRTKDAVAGAGLTIVGFGVCVWMIISAGLSDGDIPPMRTVACAFGIAVCYTVHLVFVGIAAHRLGRSVIGWVLLTAITFPLASIVAIVLLLWAADESSPTRPA